MKKINILLITALACSFTFFSCGFSNLQVPKEVKVRTDATYEFSVMNFDSTKEDSKFKVSDYFDLGKILEEKTGSDSEESSGIEIFKYNDGSQYQQFLIHMPLKEIEFDFSESFKKMDFSTQSFNVDKEIEIPGVNGLDKSESLDLRSIMTVLNGAATFTSPSLAAEMGLAYSVSPVPFSSITYTSGTLRITATGSASGTLSLYHDSEFITSAAFNENNVAELPLAGKTLYGSNMKLYYTGTPSNTVGFTGVIDSSSVIYSAEGVNLDSSQYSVPPTEVTFDINVDDNLKDILIEQGSLAITISNPSDWSPNVIGNYSIQIDGAISPALTVNKGDSTTNNLNGKHLQEGQLKATATVPINISGGKTIVFANPPLVQVTTDVKKITAEVVMADNFKADINENTDPGDIKNYVESIKWKNGAAGFKVIATNDLPDGNDMDLTLGSTQLNIPTTTKTIEAGKTNQELKYLCADDSTTTFNETTTINVTGHLGVQEGPTSTTEQKTILVSNVVPGEKYKISISVEPIFEWEEAYVKIPDNDSTRFNDKMNTGMNKKTLFATLGEDFAEKMSISSMPLYLFANVPDKLASSGMAFEGTIRGFYGKEESGNLVDVTPKKEKYILGSEGHHGEIKTDNAMPVLQKDENDEIKIALGEASMDFAEAMNIVSDEGSLCIDYDIQLAGSDHESVKVTPDYIDALSQQGKSAIKIDIIVLLTMDFRVDGVINIDMMDIAKKKDSDLLGRSEPTDTSAYDKYLQVVKSAAITVDNFMLPMSGDVALKVDLYKDGSGSTKEVGDGKSFSLEVNPGKLLAAENYPLTPDIQFVIGREGETTNFGILRTMPISGKIKLKVKAKGDIPVYPFSEQN